MLSGRIKELRKQAKISQETLAEKVGVSRQTVTKWETDRGEPGIANLIQLADVFSISVDELLGHSPAETISNQTMTQEEEIV